MSWWTLPKSNLEYFLRKLKGKLDGKVDKVTGLGLSSNDYTTADKNKLSGIASGAQVNVIETVKVNNTALTPSSKAVNITVPTKVSELTNDSGYTTNTGTITGITMNGASKGTSGVVDLGTVITAHQDISGKADKSATVSNVAWDSANKKLTKTINGTTTDVVTGATILGGLTKTQVTTALGYTPPTSDTNTTYTLAAGTGDDANKLVFTPSSGSATKVTVPYATTAGSASAVAWSGVSNKPTTLSGYGITDAKIANGVITLGSNSITPLTSFTETDPTVPSWAKTSSKPSYNFGEIGAGVAIIGDGNNRVMFRTNISYKSGMYYSTPGNEALVFANYNAVTSWIFANGDPTAGTSWGDLTPGLQIKGSCVAINKLIGNNVTPTYNLDVNGSINGTSVKVNGTDVLTALPSHTHGNIQNGGTLQTNDITIANGDKLVVTDSSDSSKIARASISFDGSTATKCLTQKGTWENFTNNAGTVTQVKVGTTAYNPSSGVISLPAYPTTLPASDVSAWAKASSKPTYTANEVGALASTTKYAGSNSVGGAASRAVKVNGVYTGSGGKQGPGYYGKSYAGFLMSDETVSGNTHCKNWLYMDCYSGTDAGGATAVGVDRQEPRMFIMQSDANRTSWNNTAAVGVFTATPTSGQVVITDGTTGGIKSSGYTIAKSVPANAVFTDHYAWSDITNKPTTLSGYGITDAKIANGTITLGSNSITPLTSHQSVTNKDATLAWSTKSTVATIGGTDITVSLPANPNTDTKVTQADWADNVNHRVLFSYSDAAGDVTNKVYKSSGFVYNPYIKKLNIGSLNATSSFISLMADSTDGAYVEFSDNTGDVLFKFNSSDQDGYLMLGNPTSKKSGTLTLVSSSGSMCTLATQTLSNFRTARLPDASGTIALDNQIFFVREIAVSITFNGEIVKAQEKDCTLSGYNILGIVGYYQGSNLAVYPEYFDVNYGNSHVTIKLRRYNNSAYTGTVTGNMKLLYTKLSRGSLANG